MQLTEKNVYLGTLIALLLLSVTCVGFNSLHSTARFSATDVQTSSATLKMSADSGIITLTGTLPDQTTKASFINAAEKVFGLSNVVDHLETKATVRQPEWLDSAKAAFPLLKSGIQNGMLVFKDKTVEVRGQVAGEEAKTKILRGLGNTAGTELTVNDQLQVAGWKSARDKKAGALQNKLNEQLFGKSIEFNTSSSHLSNDSAKLLDAIVAILKSDPNAKVEISGHTDGHGKEDKNVRLSQRRAEAIKKYLLSKGIKEARLSAMGYGSSRPIADDSTFDGQRRNRRIEFLVQE
ncbi:MAG: OmpA family protein [Burkholderiales bacterium]